MTDVNYFRIVPSSGAGRVTLRDFFEKDVCFSRTDRSEEPIVVCLGEGSVKSCGTVAAPTEPAFREHTRKLCYSAARAKLFPPMELRGYLAVDRRPSTRTGGLFRAARNGSGCEARVISICDARRPPKTAALIDKISVVIAVPVVLMFTLFFNHNCGRSIFVHCVFR